MQKVGVIGANGYVGSALVEEIKRRALVCVPVIRGESWKDKLQEADYIIYAANSGRRFFASKNPHIDYAQSVLQFYQLKKDFPNIKIILVSSISARTQLSHPYGMNRKTCELLTNLEQDLVVRLGPMLGGRKSVGAIYDILENRPVFHSGGTMYAYVPVSYNARKIVDNLDRTGLIECGGKNPMTLEDISAAVNSRSKFLGEDDTQVPLHSFADAPDTRNVIAQLLLSQKKKK